MSYHIKKLYVMAIVLVLSHAEISVKKQVKVHKIVGHKQQLDQVITLK